MDQIPISQPQPQTQAGSAARRVAANAVSPFAAQIVTKVVMLGYLIVQYRLLDGTQVGDYIIAALLFTYTSTIADWGLSTLVTRDVARVRGTAEEAQLASALFWRTLAVRLFVSVGLFVPVGIFLAVYPLLGSLSSAGVWAALLLTVSLLPGALSSSVSSLLYAYERMSLPAGIGIATSLLNVALGVAFLLLGWGVIGLALAAAAATLVTALIFWRVLRRDFPQVAARRRQTTDDGRQTTDDRRQTIDDRRQTTDDGRQTTDDRRMYAASSVVRRPSSIVYRLSSIVRRLPSVVQRSHAQDFELTLTRAEAVSLLRVGWPLMLNALLVTLFFRIDQFVISPVKGNLAVAQYGAAYSFLNFVLLITPAVTLALFPRMSRHAATDRPRLAYEYTFALKVLLALSVPLIVLTVWFAPLLVSVLTGFKPGYLPFSAQALQILILFLPFSFINGVTQYVLIALDLQRLITRAFGVTLVFNLAANLLLVPLLGINGAALTTILSELVLMGPFLVWTGRELGSVPLVSLLWKPALAGVLPMLMGLTLSAIFNNWQASWLDFAAYVGVGFGLLLLALLALFFLQPFAPDERRMLLRALRKS